MKNSVLIGGKHARRGTPRQNAASRRRPYERVDPPVNASFSELGARGVAVGIRTSAALDCEYAHNGHADVLLGVTSSLEWPESLPFLARQNVPEAFIRALAAKSRGDQRNAFIVQLYQILLYE
jgi:hypothetical protein